MTDIQSHLNLPDPVRNPALSWKEISELCKFRLNAVVVLSGLAGYLLATGQPDSRVLMPMLCAIWIAAVGASILNQVIEREQDKLMPRTANRPIAAGRVSATRALLAGLGAIFCGIALLAFLVNTLSAIMCALCSLSYLLMYTPLKRIGPFCTIVGAIPGALPPVIGWTAATNSLSSGAVALFAIMVAWQLPHFYAIAWIYREDYLQGGQVMISADDPDGRTTGGHMFMSSLNLIFVSMMPALFNLAGWIYVIGTGIIGLVFVASCLKFWVSPSHNHARFVLVSSLVYLPMLFCLWLFDVR